MYHLQIKKDDLNVSSSSSYQRKIPKVSQNILSFFDSEVRHPKAPAVTPVFFEQQPKRFFHIGVSLNGGTPPFHTPKRSFLVGKPMVVGYHHFRKPPHGYTLQGGVAM